MALFNYNIKIKNTSLIEDHNEYVEQVSIFKCKLGYIVSIELNDYITYHYSGSNSDVEMIEGFSFNNSGVEIDFTLPKLKKDSNYQRFINWDKKSCEILYVPSTNLYIKPLVIYKSNKDY